MNDLHEETAKHDSLPNKSWLQRLPSIEVAAKGVGLSAVFFYVVGFVMQNLFLGRFGVTDFDLLRAKSIMTGLLCAICFFFMGSPIYFTYFLAFRRSRNRSFKIRRRLGWLVILLSFVIMPLYLRLLIGSIGDKPSIGEAIVIASGGFVGSIMLAVQIKDHPNENDKKGALISSLGLFIMTSLLGTFMIYTMANSQFGGGSPRSVVLLLNNEGRETWHRLHKNYDDSADPFVLLLHERDTVLVIWDYGTHYDNWRNGTTIVLDRKLVHGFVPRPGPYDSKMWATQ
jgi:hypothetical protein